MDRLTLLWCVVYVLVVCLCMDFGSCQQQHQRQPLLSDSNSPRNSQQNLLLFSRTNRQNLRSLPQQNSGIFTPAAVPLLANRNHVNVDSETASVSSSGNAGSSSAPIFDDDEIEEIEYEYYEEDPNGNSGASDVVYYEDLAASNGGVTPASSNSASDGGSSSSSTTSTSASASIETAQSRPHLGLAPRKVGSASVGLVSNNLPARFPRPSQNQAQAQSQTTSTQRAQQQGENPADNSPEDDDYETVYYEDISGNSEAEQEKSPETQLTVSVSTKNEPNKAIISTPSSPSVRPTTKRIVSFTKTSATPRPDGLGGLRFSRPTGSSVVVAVQTSRSIVTPPTTPTTTTSHMGPPANNSEYDDEMEYSYPDNYPLQSQEIATTPSTTTTATVSTTQASISSTITSDTNSGGAVTESIMDKLDQVGSDLVNRLFNTAPSAVQSSNKSIATILGIGKRLSTTSQPVSSTSTSTPALTTTATVKIDTGIKFEDVSAFLPPDYFEKVGAVPSASAERAPTNPSTVSTTSTTTEFPTEAVFKTATSPTTSSTSPSTPAKKNPFKIDFQEIDFSSLAGLLPKDYKPASTTPETTTSTIPPTISSTSMATSISPEVQPESTTSKPANPLDALFGKIAFEDDISALLPPGYKETLATNSSTTSPSSSASPPAVTTKPASPVYVKPAPPSVVFPTRLGIKPGGTRLTTPEPSRAETPAPPKVTLKPAGWPSRKTTEFTGWPTVSTTPTTTVETTSTASTTPSTTISTTPSTTTTQSPKRNPPTTCEEATCKMEATLRIVSGVRWKELYSDVNTDEWKQLESTMKRELDGAYRSSGLAPFYKAVKIEAFNRGSVIVDYFVYLDHVNREITSEQMRVFFHAALLQTTVVAGSNNEEFREEETLRLGKYLVIDPKYTDFKVRNSTLDASELLATTSDPLLPHWAIAVIVISVTCLLFFLIFIVTIVVTRNRNAKKSHPNGISLTQEMLNEFNKSQGIGGGAGGSSSGGLGIGYHGHPAFTNHHATAAGRDDLYNMDDVWSDAGGGTKSVGSMMSRTFDRKPGKRSSVVSSVAGREYNIYDSWKTEWKGYTGSGNQQQNGESYYGESNLSYAVPRSSSSNHRRRGPPIPDYDTDF